MFDFDLTNVEESDYSPLPEADYTVRLTAAELKDTKAGTGQFIKAEFEVIGENYKGRKIFHQFNVKNPNTTAVQIGLGQLKTMLKKAGSTKMKITSPMDLVNLEMDVRVKIDGEYNRIASFKERSYLAPTTSSEVPFSYGR
jgi:hypothetical protein